MRMLQVRRRKRLHLALPACDTHTQLEKCQRHTQPCDAAAGRQQCMHFLLNSPWSGCRLNSGRQCVAAAAVVAQPVTFRGRRVAVPRETNINKSNKDGDTRGRCSCYDMAKPAGSCC